MESDRNKGTSGSEACGKRCGLAALSKGAQPVSSGNLDLLQLHVRITFLRWPVICSTEKCLYRFFPVHTRSKTIWDIFKDSVSLLVPVWKIPTFFSQKNKKVPKALTRVGRTCL